MTSGALRKTIIANPMVPDHEAAAFLAADDQWDALAYYWRRLLPSNVYKVLEALIEHVRFNVRTWQSGNPPMPSHERLATLSGISARTVCRILARDAMGRYTYTYQRCVYHRVTEESIAQYEAERARIAVIDPHAKPWPPCGWRIGDLVAVKRLLAEQMHLSAWLELGDLIGMFIVGVEHRRRFDEQQRRWLRTTNSYHVRPIMPLPPTLQADLAYGMQLDQVQSQRAALAEQASTIRAASDAPSSLKLPSCQPQCSANLADKFPSATLSKTSKGIASITPRGESSSSLDATNEANLPVAAVTIGNDTETLVQPDRNPPKPGTITLDSDHQIETNRRDPSSIAAAPRSVGQVSEKAAPLPDAAHQVAAEAQAQRRRQEWRDRYIQVDSFIGADIERLAALRGDGAPVVTRRLLVKRFALERTPLDRLVAALDLIDHRYDRVYGPGGKPIKTTPIATWITIAYSVIAKGRSWAHDYATQDTQEKRDAQVRRDALAAKGRQSPGYIQTKAYYQRLPGQPTATTSAHGAPKGAMRDASYQGKAEPDSLEDLTEELIERVQLEFKLKGEARTIAHIGNPDLGPTLMECAECFDDAGISIREGAIRLYRLWHRFAQWEDPGASNSKRWKSILAEVRRTIAKQ